MDRKVVKLPDAAGNEGGGGKVFHMTFESVSERDQWAAIILMDPPKGYVLARRWTDEMNLQIGFIPVPEKRKQKEETAAAPGTDDLRAELMGKSLADIKTLAAEKGITATGNVSKEKLVGVLVEKILAEKKAEPATA